MKKPYRIGDTVAVKAINSSYQLPEGLPDDATVKVVGKDAGVDEVEYQGKRYRISMVLIDSGYEPLPAGRWRFEMPDKERLDGARGRSPQ